MLSSCGVVVHPCCKKELSQTMKLLQSSKIFSQFSQVSGKMQRSSCNLSGKNLSLKLQFCSMESSGKARCLKELEGMRRIAWLVWSPKNTLKFHPVSDAGENGAGMRCPSALLSHSCDSCSVGHLSPCNWQLHCSKMCLSAVPAVFLFSCALNSLTVGKDWRLFTQI